MQNSGGSRRGHLPGLGSENRVVKQSRSQTLLDVRQSESRTVRQSEVPRVQESNRDGQTDGKEPYRQTHRWRKDGEIT